MGTHPYVVVVPVCASCDVDPFMVLLDVVWVGGLNVEGPVGLSFVPANLVGSGVYGVNNRCG